MRTGLVGCALAAALLVAFAAINANACTAIVVGRKASATGHVLVGHNEDFAKSFMRHAMLPRREGKTASTSSRGGILKWVDPVSGKTRSRMTAVGEKVVLL